MKDQSTIRCNVLEHLISLGYLIVKRKCQQRWSTIPPIHVSIKGTITSCLRSSIDLKKEKKKKAPHHMTLEIKVVAWDGHSRNMAGFTFVQSSEGLRSLVHEDPKLSIVGKDGCSEFCCRVYRV